MCYLLFLTPKICVYVLPEKSRYMSPAAVNQSSISGVPGPGSSHGQHVAANSPAAITFSAGWLAYCGSGRKKSLTELISAFPGRPECVKSLRDLNKEISAYHNMALALGGSSDCEQLRGELKRIRRRAQELVNHNKTRLQTQTEDFRLSDEERNEVDRLWCLLYCCVYILGMEMQRTWQLQQSFAIYTAPAGFINTGLHEYDVGHKGGSIFESLDVPLVDRLSLEKAETSQLQKEIQELDSTLSELRSSVDLETFLQEELLGRDRSQQAFSLCSEGSLGLGELHSAVGSEDVTSMVDDLGIAMQHRRCLCGVMAIMISIVVLAAVLGVCIALWS